MAIYALMAKFTDKGASGVRDLPSRLKAFKESAREAGGEVKGAFLAMGPFDTLSLVQAPNDDVAAKIALSLCQLGNARTQTYRLFTEEEIVKLVAALRS